MATIATGLTEFSDKENNRTWMVTGHTVSKPRLITQKRKLALNLAASQQSTISVVYGTVDAVGTPIAGRVVFEVNVRAPVNAASADVAAALVVFRDVVASDEFTATVTSQGYIKP